MNKEKYEKILCIDPSGTGTTGFFFISRFENNKEFYDFQQKNWEEHLKFIINLVKKKRPQIIIFEHTNYISIRGKDMTSLFKLFGAIQTLCYVFDFLEEVCYIPVNKVKEIKKNIYKKIKNIDNLFYKTGRGYGWMYCKKRLSIHQLDAFFLYHLWERKYTEKKLFI